MTGAGGFVGATLVRALCDARCDVVGLIRPAAQSLRLDALDQRIQLVEVDISDGRALERVVARSRPDLAVNLVVAGTHPTTPVGRTTQLEVSVIGTARLVEGLARAGCSRLVHLGSSLEYGPRQRPLRENDSVAPVVPRGIAKAAESVVCIGLAGALGMSAVVLRPFSIFGPWESESRLVPAAIRAALDDVELPLTEPGLSHDFVHVGEVVRAIMLALGGSASLDGRVFNVGSGVSTTNEELVEMVGRITRRRIRTVPGAFPTRAHDRQLWVADTTRAHTELGWESADLEVGLRSTILWWQARRNAGLIRR